MQISKRLIEIRKNDLFCWQMVIMQEDHYDINENSELEVISTFEKIQGIHSRQLNPYFQAKAWKNLD